MQMSSNILTHVIPCAWSIMQIPASLDGMRIVTGGLDARGLNSKTIYNVRSVQFYNCVISLLIQCTVVSSRSKPSTRNPALNTLNLWMRFAKLGS